MKVLLHYLKTKVHHDFYFIFILLLVAFYYNYNDILTYRPQSTHKWRQTDCTSIARNYYQGGMKLFQPEVNNLTSEKGTSGKAFTSELPFYYYGIATLYKFFGPNEIIYRFINTLIFLLGLYYLFKLGILLTGSSLWAILLAILFFSSPVLVYYGNNFLTNTSALSFSIIAWFLFFKYVKTKQRKFILLAIFIFFVAATFKITALISLFAIGLLIFAEALGIPMKDKNKMMFNKPWRLLFLAGAFFALIASYIIYARVMNENNECYYFSTVTFPIWSLNKYEIIKVWNKIREIWLTQYYHISVHAFFTLITMYLFLNFKKLPRFNKWLLVAVILQIIVFVLLQFWTFKDHDYYVIGLYILPIFITITTLGLIKNNNPKILNSIWVKIFAVLFVLFNIHYAKAELYNRYNAWWNDKDQYADLYDIEPTLRDLGINYEDTVIAIPDGSHASLYYMNQKGWTNYTEAQFNKGVRYKYNSDSATIQESIKRGADYLILNGIENLYTNDYLKYYCTNLLGRHKNVLIFDLHALDTNFNVYERSLKSYYFCDADTLTSNKDFFVNDSLLFEYGKSQTEQYCVSGKYSSKLNHEIPYGMTIKLGGWTFGETVSIKVWRKSAKSLGSVVAQIIGKTISQNVIIDTNEDGWELIETSVFITQEFVGKEMVIFAYNSDEESVFFDDLSIEVYHSVVK